METAAVQNEGVRTITFGCRLNALESASIAAHAPAGANAILVNTCSVTAEAVRQARQAIRRARREAPAARIIVTGCAAQIDPESFARMAEVDLVLGNREKLDPKALGGHGPRVRALSFDVPLPTGEAVAAAPERARTYVQIQNGCDHRCTFCVIPLGRGPSRSTPSAIVVERVRQAVAQGVQEVVLTGVDLTSWGVDLREGEGLGDLVGAVLDGAPELARLRLSSIDAAEVDDALVERFGGEPRLMPHMHLSLQSGDDLILKRMRRRHRRADALRLIERLRAARPEAAFGADLIAGFPTESEEAFENTLRFIVEAGLAFLHVFPFSPRPGAPAARMPQTPVPLRRERAERLRAAGRRELIRHLDAKIGRAAEAAVEGPGRARAPDFTRIAFEGSPRVGSVIRGRIESHDGDQGWLAPAPSAREAQARPTEEW